MPDVSGANGSRVIRKHLLRAIDELTANGREQPVSDRVLRWTLQGTIALADQLHRDMQNQENAELATVYASIAEELAGIAGLSEERTYRCVLALCGEAVDGPLAGSLPAADPAACATIRDRLVGITVRYDAIDQREAGRTIEILHGPDAHGIKARTIASRHRWDEVPADIRRRVLAGSAVTYQLFPAQGG